MSRPETCRIAAAPQREPGSLCEDHEDHMLIVLLV
jgi:hypothetical protein